MNQETEGKEQATVNNNASIACTWLSDSNCRDKGCKLHGSLACRWDAGEYSFLMGVVQIPPALIMTFTLVLVGVATGNWWGMAIFAWLVIIWPLGLETLVLCRHCPFFTDNGKTLTCWALRYWPKWWKYSPRPLQGWEKFVVTYLLFGLPYVWPVGWAGYGIYHITANYSEFGLVALLGMIGACFATIVSGVQFFLILWAKACNRCVNFSCPFNEVPKQRVDAYLALNPVMKAAWIDSGYEFGNSQREKQE